jgi:hypothetical protein
MVDRMNAEFYRKLQRYVVNTCIDITVLRRRPPGTVEAAQKFLYEIDLAQFAEHGSFRHVLDSTTGALSCAFLTPSWGHARKCLNIFLRRVAYDHYLREKYGLGAAERLLEVPLDSNVAKGITHDAAKYGLNRPPRWNTIFALTPAENDQWQDTASEIAGIKKIDRVHLDLWYWRPQQEDVSSLTSI